MTFRLTSFDTGWMAKVRDYAPGASVGYKVMDNMRLSPGYNVLGLNDRDFTASAYSPVGWAERREAQHLPRAHVGLRKLSPTYILACLWIIILLAFANAANAATYTVTKIADTKDGTCNADCSLREAIDAANGAGAGPHTINIPAGTYTISGAGDDTNTAGDFDINVAIDFVGAGSSSTILDGNLSDRIFHVRIAGTAVSVTGMKFIQGRAGASTGGGINSLSGNITVTDSIFDDCDGSQGGALYTNNASTITISGSTITNSNGTGAGGAMNGGTISITSSTFTNNATTGGHGGAVYASGAGGSITVTGTSSFSGNSASSYGGAIYAANTASITGATFNLNHADTATQRGGAVHVAALGQFTNCTITNNSAAGQGGGINGLGNIEITNSTISGNSVSAGAGGGVYAGGTLTINATTTIDNNTATAQGAGAFAGGAATVSGAIITNNTSSTATTTHRGGGITVSGNSTFTNSTISNNTIASGTGGGIGTAGTYTLNISNSTISGNRSTANAGGGIYSLGAITISNSTVSNNQTVGAYAGGGIYSNAAFTATDSTFSGNSAGGGNGGGAVYANAGSSLTRSTFSSNSSATLGGAIYNIGAAINLYGANTFTGNHANGSGGNAGGCVYTNQALTINDAGSVFSGNYGGGSGGCIWDSSTLNINGATTFDGNYSSAAGGGGAIISQGGTMTNVTFVNNHALDFGGAFYPLTTYTINNSTFENNYLDSATTGGGAIYLKNAVYTVTINNSTFSGNNAGGGQGGAINTYNNASTYAKAYNSTFYNNTASGTTQALFAGSSGRIQLFNSIISHPSANANLCNNTGAAGNNNVEYNNTGTLCTAATGRITTDPKLLTLAYNGGPTKTMALDTGSSAIDASGASATASDQRGVAAVGTRDAGAYESSGSASDTVAPAPVSNLATGAIGATTVQLTWTAPGDDYGSGTATTYDVRYSTSPITEGTWAGATAATGEPAPSVAGTSENFTVTGLSNSTTYYFAIKTSDEVPNTSTISNVVSATTTAGGITISGTLYSDEGTTVIATGPTVRLIANGSSVGTAVANGSGVYSITASVNAGDAIIAYIDSDGGAQGNAVTVSNGANLSGLNIYQNRVIARHDNGSSLTNALMSTAKGAYADADILYSVDGSNNLTVAGASSVLYIPAAHTYAPGTSVTTADLKNLGTITGGTTTFNVSGNWTNSGTFTANTSTVNLNGTNQTITGSTTFNNLTKSVISAATLTFAAGSTTTVNGTATLNGASGQLLSLVSSSPGTYWSFTLGAASTKAISYVSVTDSDASGSDAAKKPVNPANSNDGGHNLSWFVPSLIFLKTVAVTSDPFNGGTNPKYIPGAEALFTMRVTNSSAGTVDNNTLIITDPIPANTEVFTGDLSGGAPFIFADGTPSSGLTCAFTALGNLADCMDFSNDSGASWTYVPNGSFDPAVTNIRFSLSGTMNGSGGGNPYFDLKFRLRVK